MDTGYQPLYNITDDDTGPMKMKLKYYQMTYYIDEARRTPAYRAAKSLMVNVGLLAAVCGLLALVA